VSGWTLVIVRLDISGRERKFMLITDSIFDLGNDGIFTLSLDTFSHVYGPVLPEKFHYANWRNSTGEVIDRSEVVRQEVSEVVLQSAMSVLQTSFFRAAPTIVGQIQWTQGLIRGKNYLRPCAADYVGKGRLILLFRGGGLPAMLRLVDVIHGEILHELSYTESDLGAIAGESYFGRDCRIENSCENYFMFFVGGKRHLFSCEENRLFLIKSMGLDQFERCGMGAGYLLAGGSRNQRLELFKLDDFSVIEGYESPYAGWMFMYAGCNSTGIFVVSHGGGTVEILRLFEGVSKAYRPFPKLGKSAQLHVGLDGEGRFVLATDYADGCIIDLLKECVAYFDVPRRDDSDRNVFTGQADYFPAWIAGGNGLFTVHRGLLNSVPYDQLQWQPAVLAKVPGGRKATAAKFPARLLKKWRKPYIQLIPGLLEGEAGRSHLYGAVELPAGTAWPTHEMHPMLLLAQIDLAEMAEVGASSGFPMTGTLLVFTAVDEAGEVLEDDFVPAKITVLYLDGACKALAEGTAMPTRPPVFLHMEKGQHDLPAIDSLIVGLAEINDEAIEQYRHYLEHKLPVAPGPDFRLGGYPASVQNNDLEQQAQGVFETGENYAWSEDIESSMDWSLLMQFDTDDEFMWGTDTGRLYLMIRQQDLKKRDFSHVVALTAGS
jgi:uncharacterized protein YwqG